MGETLSITQKMEHIAFQDISWQKAVAGLVFLFWFVLSPFNAVQLISIALLPALLIAQQAYSGNGTSLKRFDMLWLGLIVFGVLSTIWATNVSKVWNPIVTWSCLLLIFYVSRDLFQQHRYVQIFVMGIFFVFSVTLIHQLYAIHLQIPFYETDWNSFLFKNRNFTTSYLLVLYPFVVFANIKNQFLRFLKVVATALVINVIYLTSAGGAALALFLFGLYCLVCKYEKVSLKNNRVLIPQIGLVILLPTLIVLFVAPLSEMLLSNDFSSRKAMIQFSLQAFGDNPIVGVGMGNWFTEVYQYIDETTSAIFANSAMRLQSHNMYTKMLAELGVGGLLLLLTIVIVPIYRVLTSLQSTTWQIKAGGGAILMYAITASFYHDINIHAQHFSAIQVMAMVCMGLVMANTSTKRELIPSRISTIVLITLGILATSWFIFERGVHRRGYQAISSIQDSTVQKSIEDLKAVYHPVWHTNLYHVKTYPELLGELHEKNNDEKQAIEYYEEAQRIDPYSSTVIAAIARLSK